MERKRKLFKLAVFISVVAVIAIAAPFMSGCLGGQPAAAPPEAPPAAEEPVAPPAEPAAEAPTYTFRLQNLQPPIQSDVTTRPVMDWVEEASGGRITIDLFSSAELVPDDQVVSALKAGTLDMAIMQALSQPCDLSMAPLDAFPPYAWNSAAELLSLLHERGLGEIFKRSYSEMGVQHIGFCPADPISMGTTSPIESVDDFDGKRIITEASAADVFGQFGAIAVDVPVEEYYLAGETGIVDGLGWSGATEFYTNGWYEVYPYYMDPPFSGQALNHWVMNQEAWDALTPDLQRILKMASNGIEIKWTTYYYSGESKYRQYLNVTTLSREDMAQLRAVAAEQRAEYATRNQDLAEAVSILDAYNAEADVAKWYR